MSNDYERVEAAIHYLESHFKDQPTLDDLAAYLHLSPYHLQRLFKRWSGISPKRFVQFLTIDYARQLLDEAHSVLDTAYETGLSSPSRLHDLFINVDAMTPGEYKQQGQGLDITYGFHDTPFGICLVAITDRGICDLNFVASDQTDMAVEALAQRWRAAKINEQPQHTQATIDIVFPSDPAAGKRQISLLLAGTNFQIKVWEALLNIPFGSAWSYQDVAESMGRPSAVRAAASAVANNSIAYLIPCHRVLRKNGDTGKYRWNRDRKRAMLGWEAARREQPSFYCPTPS